jgi:hypothetical protein
MRIILTTAFLLVVCYMLAKPANMTTPSAPVFDPIAECKKLDGKVVLQEYANYPQNRFGFRACIVDADKLTSGR